MSTSTTGFSFDELSAISEQYYEPDTLIMRADAYARLGVSKFGDVWGGPPSIFGVPVTKTDMPLKQQVLKSKDRFCEYDEADAKWAVPLGLAEWSEEDVDAVAIKTPIRNLMDDLEFLDDPVWGEYEKS